MSEISKDDHDYVKRRRRDAAIVIDEAEQAVPISERDGKGRRFRSDHKAIRWHES